MYGGLTHRRYSAPPCPDMEHESKDIPLFRRNAARKSAVASSSSEAERAAMLPDQWRQFSDDQNRCFANPSPVSYDPNQQVRMAMRGTSMHTETGPVPVRVAPSRYQDTVPVNVRESSAAPRTPTTYQTGFGTLRIPL